MYFFKFLVNIKRPFVLMMNVQEKYQINGIKIMHQIIKSTMMHHILSTLTINSSFIFLWIYQDFEIQMMLQKYSLASFLVFFDDPQLFVTSFIFPIFWVCLRLVRSHFLFFQFCLRICSFGHTKLLFENYNKDCTNKYKILQKTLYEVIMVNVSLICSESRDNQD